MMAECYKVCLVLLLRQVIIVGLITGSLFYQLDNTINSSRQFFSAAFLAIMFNTMTTLPVLPVTMATKGVWYKWRDNYFYPPYAHAIGTTIASVRACWAWSSAVSACGRKVLVWSAQQLPLMVLAPGNKHDESSKQSP